MRAIIAAAGLSSRIGGGVPKNLLPIHESVALLNLTITQLKRLGFDVTVVIGFKAPFFLSMLTTTVSFVYNPIYSSTACLYSLKCAVDLFGERPLLFAYGDQIIKTKALEQLIQQPDSILITPLTKEEGVEYAIGVENDIATEIIRFKKFPSRLKGYYGFGGFAFLTERVLGRLEKLSPEILATEDLPAIFRGCRTVRGECENINRPADLIRVQRKLMEEYHAYQ